MLWRQLNVDFHCYTAVRDDGDTITFLLRSGDHKELDAGLYELATVGGIAFEDNNANGILDVDEDRRIAVSFHSINIQQHHTCLK